SGRGGTAPRAGGAQGPRLKAEKAAPHAPARLIARKRKGFLRDYQGRPAGSLDQQKIFRWFWEMTSGVLLDTGPLVAYLTERDSHHEWAFEIFDSFDLPAISCEPVLTEACFLLERNR